MKIMIFISILPLFCTACNKQNNKLEQINIKITELQRNDSIKLDTFSVLLLNNKQYNNYTYSILELYDVEFVNSHIELIKDKEIKASISIPSPENVKNFQIEKIYETNNGFNISIFYGGGDNMYDIVYYFVFTNGEFYLNKIEKGHQFKVRNNYYDEERETIEINNKIPFSDFKIKEFLF